MERYEAVVVGAGPAGSAAAYELARNGVQTLVVERGKFPGAKNVTGGILYGQTDTPYNLDYLLPEFQKEAPLERPISRYMMHAVHGDRVRTLDITPVHEHNTKWSYAVLRAKFDRWFAERVHHEARRSGGGVLSEVRVRGPLLENGRIVGVETDELDPIRADVVIAADGATSELARKSGLRGWLEPEQWFQGVKAVVKLDAAKIEERFGIGPDQGSAHLVAGDLFEGVRGGGFVYTNRDTLSIGTVFHLDSLADRKVEPHRLLDRLLTHPVVADYVRDDYDEIEYSAKLIPDGKKAVLTHPAKDRLLVCGDAAGQMWAAGPVIKGMNLGISSGILAAQAYLRAKGRGDGAAAGEEYVRLLRETYVHRELAGRRFAKTAVRAFSAVGGAFLGPTLLKMGFVRSQVEGMFANARMAELAPDTEFVYVKLPSMLAAACGERREARYRIHPKSLDDRIGALGYDTDIGRAHILLLDDAPTASGKAVHTCPVSSTGSSRGCYRLETVKTREGATKDLVVLDTQPCIECGTCAVVAKTKWEHPRGGKGVGYRYG
ncbi:MAG: FAD-dependent oxidoreductase [Methanobacteriota archaeon]